MVSFLYLLGVSTPSLAALPKVEPPSSGGGGGGLMDTLKGHVQDGLVIGGLILAAIAFIVVAQSAITTFAEVRAGKAEWSKFATIIVVGIVLLVAVIWLVGKSAGILF
ncbi:TIGR03745 family integrating conjugative element membrane protein [Xenorhabdus koppenhoeferi]|nr:TIGR03745 family integrating conjugative element membrane protein [Xenorhabdus koppenhoeferi]